MTSQRDGRGWAQTLPFSAGGGGHPNGIPLEAEGTVGWKCAPYPRAAQRHGLATAGATSHGPGHSRPRRWVKLWPQSLSYGNTLSSSRSEFNSHCKWNTDGCLCPEGFWCLLLTGCSPVGPQRERTGPWTPSPQKIQVPKASVVSTRSLSHHRRVKNHKFNLHKSAPSILTG